MCERSFHIFFFTYNMYEYKKGNILQCNNVSLANTPTSIQRHRFKITSSALERAYTQ